VRAAEAVYLEAELQESQSEAKYPLGDSMQAASPRKRFPTSSRRRPLRSRLQLRRHHPATAPSTDSPSSQSSPLPKLPMSLLRISVTSLISGPTLRNRHLNSLLRI
jgi:hypothetical protein